MTAPTYQSTTVTDFGSDSTNHSANMPATVNAGDLLLALVATDGNPTITTPSGWTLLLSVPSSIEPAFGLYGKVAAGTEGGTTVNWVTSASERGSIHILRVSSWFGSLDGVISGAGRCAGTFNDACLSIGSTAKDVLWIAAQWKSSATAWGTVPSGYSNENKTNISEDSSSSASIASATKAATQNRESISTMWNAVSGFFNGLVAVLPTAGSSAGGAAQLVNTSGLVA